MTSMAPASNAPHTPPNASRPTRFRVRVAAVTQLASDIRGYELRAPDGAVLPGFTPGAHISVRTPIGEMRHYSLCNHPDERDRYVIAVKREVGGRGGSRSLYDHTAPGSELLVEAPVNDFPLAEGATHHLLIAGGIGVTPILCMARWLAGRGASFEVLLCARTPGETAFAGELEALGDSGPIRIHHDGGDPARLFDLAALLRHPVAGTHAYCCGPTPMLRAVRTATEHWPRGTVHFEDFGSAAGAREGDRPFIVRVEDTGEEFEVPPGGSILDVLREHGYDVPSSCESGTCGTCMMRLVEGPCEHRDFVLDDGEREHYLMVCVSRAAGARITIGF